MSLLGGLLEQVIANMESETLAKTNLDHLCRVANWTEDALADPNNGFAEEDRPLNLSSPAAMPFLRVALFGAICQRAELCLKDACEKVSRELSPARAFSQFELLAGESTSHYCLRYLRDVGGFELTGFEEWPEWAAFDACIRVRDCIRDRTGIVERDEDRAKIRTLRHVELDESGLGRARPRIQLLPGSCKWGAECCAAFFGRLPKTLVESELGLPRA